DVIPTTMTLKQAIEKRKQALNEDTPSIQPSKKLKTTSQEAPEEEQQQQPEEEEEEEEEEGDTVMEESKA
ncbi:hypothetical protein A0J61_08200, partial [Choanephora cucurbitarum]